MRDHVDCPEWLRSAAADVGLDVHVTTVPPLVAGPYPTQQMTCPHGTKFYYEPTGEQIAKWVKDGAP